MFNVLEAIKGEKKMTFRHWRYRLLHWAFGVHPSTPNESTLPNYLYTHYCPLFHLTNLIAIFVPVILFCKLTLLCLQGIIFVAQKIGRGFIVVAGIIRPLEKVHSIISEEEIHRRLKVQERRDVYKRIARFGTENRDFLRFFDRYYPVAYKPQFLTKEEVKEIWDVYAPKLLAALEKRDARTQRRREFILFWVNFSRVFIKGILNVMYVSLFAAVAYLTYRYGWPVLQGIGIGLAWLVALIWRVPWTTVLDIVWHVVAIIAFGMLVGWLMVRYAPSIVKKISPPFVAFRDMIIACMGYVGNIFDGVTDFVKVFYEENCPPITIVDTADDPAEVADDLSSLSETFNSVP